MTEHVHDQRFDGDDPYLICHGCGQRWDALTGKPIGPMTAPDAPRDVPAEGPKLADMLYGEVQQARQAALDDVRRAWDDHWHATQGDREVEIQDRTGFDRGHDYAERILLAILDRLSGSPS